MHLNIIEADVYQFTDFMQKKFKILFFNSASFKESRSTTVTFKHVSVLFTTDYNKCVFKSLLKATFKYMYFFLNFTRIHVDEICNKFADGTMSFSV